MSEIVRLMGEKEIGEIMYQSLNSILDNTIDQVNNLRRATPGSQVRDNISNYLQTLVILRRSVEALMENIDDRSSPHSRCTDRG